MKAQLEMKKFKSQMQTAQRILESLKTGTFSTDHGKNKYVVQFGLDIFLHMFRYTGTFYASEGSILFLVGLFVTKL